MQTCTVVTMFLRYLVICCVNCGEFRKRTLIQWWRYVVYLIKLEEGPEHLLGTGGRLLSVWVITLSLEIIGGGAISVKMIIQEMLKGEIL